MSLSNLKLSSIILGVSGIATGTSFGLHNYFTKWNSENKKIEPEEIKGKEISEWLADDNSVLLKENEDSEEWKTKWGHFVDSNTTEVLPEAWKFEEYSTKKTDKNNVPTAFKEKCKSNGKSIIKNKGDGEYNNVKKYCTKENQKPAS